MLGIDRTKQLSAIARFSKNGILLYLYVVVRDGTWRMFTSYQNNNTLWVAESWNTVII